MTFFFPSFYFKILLFPIKLFSHQGEWRNNEKVRGLNYSMLNVNWTIYVIILSFFFKWNKLQHGRGTMWYITDDPEIKERSNIVFSFSLFFLIFLYYKIICFLIYHFFGVRYEGEWLDGESHGKGVYYYADGSYYDGSWVVGKMTGKGTFVYANGNRYTGDFLNDFKDGTGTLLCPNGEKYEVFFLILFWIYISTTFYISVIFTILRWIIIMLIFYVGPMACQRCGW